MIFIFLGSHFSDFYTVSFVRSELKTFFTGAAVASKSVKAGLLTAVDTHGAFIKVVTMFQVFVQHESTAALAPITTVVINAFVLTTMHTISTFVHVFAMSSILRQVVTMATHAAVTSIWEMNTVMLAAVSFGGTLLFTLMGMVMMMMFVFI